MTTLVYILAWLLINTWLTIIVLKACDVAPYYWTDLMWVALMSVTTIFPFLLVRWVNTIKQKNKKRA